MSLLLTPGRSYASASAGEATMAREIAADINNERAARGLRKLPVDAGYSAGAQDVAENNRDRACHPCHSTSHPSGEIVWWGSDYGSSASTIWWMGSSPHRALMLAPNATKLGVGVACKGTEHDAVAWIETPTAATNAPATPIVTKEGTGSRCTRSRPTATSVAGATATTTAPRTTSTRSSTQAARGTTSTSKASNAGRRTATSRVTVTGGAARPGPSRFEVAAAPPPQLLRTRTVAAASPVATKGGGDGQMIMSLVATFVGVFTLGRFTHRRQQS